MIVVKFSCDSEPLFHKWKGLFWAYWTDENKKRTLKYLKLGLNIQLHPIMNDYEIFNKEYLIYTVYKIY